MAGVKNKKAVKAAVIGCGRIGAITVHTRGDDLPARCFPINHCAAICATPGLKLAAVCDTNYKAAKEAAKMYGVKNIYTDWRKMILDEKPEILSIATRTAGRVEIIEFAARHGVLAMHIEKPIAINLGGTKRALRAIEKNNVAISYGTIRRYMPVFNQAKEILISGKFGALKEIVIDIGKSQLMWSQPHCVDLINFFSGGAEVDYVESSFPFDKNDVSSKQIDMDPVLDSAFIKLKNQVVAKIIDTNKQYVKLICERGEIIINIGGKYLKIKNKNVKIENVKIGNNTSGRCRAMAELRDSINYGSPTSMVAADILNEQKVLMALGSAGTTHKKTKPNEVGDAFTVTGKFNNLYP